VEDYSGLLQISVEVFLSEKTFTLSQFYKLLDSKGLL